MEWIELVLPAGDMADEVAALLAMICPAAAQGVQVRGDDVVAWAPVGEADAALLEVKAAARRLVDEGFAIDLEGIVARPAPPEDEWRDAWKRYFHVTRLGARLVIVPSWETFTPGPDDVVLDLDPGRAFGTGAHASTKLCLRAIEALSAAGLEVRRFLDVGTGSGILSIAAAKLWPAATGVAVDVDPISIGCAEENLERNGALGRVAVSETVAADVEGAFELVVANIQADVLEVLRDALVARMAPGGALLLSGLLSEQVQTVAAQYVEAGLRLAEVTTLPEDPAWSAAVLRRS